MSLEHKEIFEKYILNIKKTSFKTKLCETPGITYLKK